MDESAQAFSFLARNPGTVRVRTRNEKAKAISVICAAWRTATAESKIMHTYKLCACAERVSNPLSPMPIFFFLLLVVNFHCKKHKAPDGDTPEEVPQKMGSHRKVAILIPVDNSKRYRC